MTPDNIKQQAAKDLGFKDFNDYQNGIYTRSAEQYFEFTDRCIELALSQKPEAGISIEQAKDLAAQENGFNTYHRAYFEIGKIKDKLNQRFRIDKITDRAFEIYASSAVKAAIEAERNDIHQSVEKTLAYLNGIRRHGLIENESYKDAVMFLGNAISEMEKLQTIINNGSK